MYASYTAASFARKHDLAERHGVNLEGALTWAFEFEDQPYFAGFRVLATNGIDLPVLNGLRGGGGRGCRRMSDARSTSTPSLKEGVRGKPDVGGLASRDAGKVRSWPGTITTTTCRPRRRGHRWRSTGLPLPKAGQAKLTHFRIDATHSNAYTAWKKMGPTTMERTPVEKSGNSRSGPDGGRNGGKFETRES